MNIQQKTEKLYDGVFNFVQNSLNGFLFGRFLNINNLNKNMNVLFDEGGGL